MSQKHKKEDLDWECGYCGKEFETMKELEEHELNCKDKPFRIRGIFKLRFGFIEGLGFGFGFSLGVFLMWLLLFIVTAIFGLSLLKIIGL